MNDGTCRRQSGIVGGLILIAIGSIFLLNNLDIIYIHDVWKYWPVILIVIGVGKLAERGAL
jgi:hypothetical protein